MGSSYFNGGAAFFIADQSLYDPAKMSSEKNAYLQDGKFLWRVNGVRWFTNLDHGRRHEPLKLMTMADNLKFNKKLKGQNNYYYYDNYDAIEVPLVELIPCDYEGKMGVPVSFLDKYNPNQFEIIGLTANSETMDTPVQLGSTFMKDYREQGGTGHFSDNMYGVCYYDQEGNAKVPYGRIIIRKNQ